MMHQMLESAKRLHMDLKEGTAGAVKSEKADERSQQVAIDGQWPISDEIKFRFSGTVAIIRGDVMARVLVAVSYIRTHTSSIEK